MLMTWRGIALWLGAAAITLGISRADPPQDTDKSPTDVLSGRFPRDPEGSARADAQPPAQGARHRDGT